MIAANRLIEIDSRPLDQLVQRAVAHAASKEMKSAFGAVHEIEIGALSLRDLAHHYLTSVANEWKLQ